MKLYRYLIWSLFIAFVLFSNKFDWDHFFAFAEVERRSWLFDFSPPLWTYQLCAGVTRAGDPQSFGLSPLFLFPLVFGSFWGLKLLVIASAGVGVYFCRKCLNIFSERMGFTQSFIEWAALSLIFSNFFLWHFLIGNITFLLVYPAIGIFYYFYAALTKKLSHRELTSLAALSFLIFTAGFYHVAVFFLMPVIIAFFCTLVVRCIQLKKIQEIRSGGLALGAFAVGFILAAYRWLPIVFYQHQFPRNVYFSGDWVSIFELFRAVFFPTSGLLYLGRIPSEGPWPIWDFSVFSWLPLIFTALAIISIAPKISRLKWLKKPRLPSSPTTFLILGLLFSLIFYFGDLGPWSPYALLNQYVFSQSMRNASRFGFVVILFLLFFLIHLLSREGKPLVGISILMSKPAISILYILLAVNFVGFTDLIQESPKLSAILSLEKADDSEIRNLEYVIPRSNNLSFMYPAVLRGNIVPNCYCPLNRKTEFSGQYNIPKEYRPRTELPWILAKPECVAAARITQNKIFIPSGCGDFCLALNDVRAAQFQELKLVRQGRLLCSTK